MPASLLSAAPQSDRYNDVTVVSPILDLPTNLPTGRVQPAIFAYDVQMTYQTGRRAVPILKGVNLAIQPGTIQLLMGPSGSGKTTFLSILAGILTPTGGAVKLLGEDITQLSKKALAEFRLENIGFIFQGFNLFPALTARENIEIALNLKGISGRKARKEAKELLGRVGLGDRVNNLPRDLSGGEKQRVAVARAIAQKPPLILADEPTAALDAHSGHQVMELLRKLAKEDNSTVVVVTHDPRIVDLADQIVHMEDGQLNIPDICPQHSQPQHSN